MFNLLEKYWLTIPINDTVFLDLAYCLQKWCTVQPTNSITKVLTEWAITSANQSNNQYSLALLSTILLGSAVEVPTNEDFSKWFAPLADILLKEEGQQQQEQVNDSKKNNNLLDLSTTTTTTTKKKNILLNATLENLRNGNENRLLSNLLGLTKSPQLVLLIHYVLSQPQNEKLKVAVALLARGDTLDDPSTINKAPNETNNVTDWEDLDDSDMDDEETDQQEEHRLNRR